MGNEARDVKLNIKPTRHLKNPSCAKTNTVDLSRSFLALPAPAQSLSQKINMPRQAVQDLLDEGFVPACCVEFHHLPGAGQSQTSPNGLVLAPCCASALTSFKSGVIAACARCSDPLQAVLAHLNGSFAWGVHFQTYLCEMMRCSSELDCGGMTAIAILALECLKEAEESQGKVRKRKTHCGFYCSVGLWGVWSDMEVALCLWPKAKVLGAS